MDEAEVLISYEWHVRRACMFRVRCSRVTEIVLVLDVLSLDNIAMPEVGGSCSCHRIGD